MIDWNDVEQILKSGKAVQVKVRGVSMYPHVFTDDIVHLQPWKKSNALRKPLVLAKSQSGYTLHRLYFDQNGFTRGDNLETADAPIEEILGLVVKRRFTVKSILKRINYFCKTNFIRIKNMFWRMQRLLEDHYCDKKYNIETRQEVLHTKYQKYEPSSWLTSYRILKSLHVSDKDVFLDVGCGKGRVLFVAQQFAFQKIYGIEEDQAVFRILQKNLQLFSAPSNKIEIFNKDILNTPFPDEVNFIYFFNPFVGQDFDQFFFQLLLSLKRSPRNLRFLTKSPTAELTHQMKKEKWHKNTELPLSFVQSFALFQNY